MDSGPGATYLDGVMREDFEAVIDRVATGAGRESLPSSWAQGRTIFGGIITAACLRAARPLVEPDRVVLSVDAMLLGPVAPEQPVGVTASVARAGKYMTLVETRAEQGGEDRARVMISLGRPRASKIAVTAEPRTLTPRNGDPLPHIEGVTPTFLQHFELTWSVGAYPFAGVTEPIVGGWCRHRGTATGEEAILALLDAWPAPVLSLLHGPAPASTVRWTAHFVETARFVPGAHTFFECHALSARDGYATTLGHLYDDQGRAIAWMEQLVAVFDG